MHPASRERRVRAYEWSRQFAEVEEVRCGSRYRLSLRGSFGVRLIFGPCCVEGGKFQTGSIDRNDLREFVEWYLEAPRVGDLRHQADVSDGDAGSAGVRSRTDHLFQRGKPPGDPMVIPSINVRLLVLEVTLEILQSNQIVEWVNIASDHLRDRARLGATERIFRQQRWFRLSFI